jgi:hypothetical protein
MRRRVLEALVAGCVALAVWIVVLGLRLPRVYHAEHWDLAWVGLDVALLVGLAATAWAAWRRRAIIVLFATATATLLLADAWFDVTTAGTHDFTLSAIQAAFVEIPGAIFLMYIVVRVLSFTRGSVWSDRIGDRPRSLCEVEFQHPADSRLDTTPVRDADVGSAGDPGDSQRH